MLSDDEVAAVLAAGEDLDTTARHLVRAANERGGRDNITVVVFRVESLGADAAAEDATLVGAAAEEAGFTADAVREAVEEGATRPPVSARGPAPAVPPRRRRGWGRRALRVAAVLAVLALLAFGAVYGARQVWFLGTDEAGRVSLFRGLPYELPFGVELYSETYSSPITIDAVPEDRRDAVTNHELRSRDDAVSLIEDLQLAAEQAAAAEAAGGRQRGGRNGGGGGGGGNSGGGRGGQSR
jgi:uncharacterized membrane protein YgcG